ncbi:MAG: hypothetical protein ACE5IZ_09425 [Dehalococcoidia bacterium]
MVQLVKTEPFDWQKYPPLTKAQAKLRDLEGRLAVLEKEATEATEAETAAKGEADEEEVRYLIDQANDTNVAAAREAYERAKIAADLKRDALEPHRQAVERLRGMLPTLELEAKQDALDRATPAYAKVVARLAKALRAASEINEELFQLRASIPHVTGYNLGRFPMPWPQLRPKIEGESNETPLQHWLREAKENGFL